MRFTLNHVLVFTILLLQFSSCTVEKRRYTSGYHIEWHRNEATNSREKKTDPDDECLQSVAPPCNNTVYADASPAVSNAEKTLSTEPTKDDSATEQKSPGRFALKESIQKHISHASQHRSFHALSGNIEFLKTGTRFFKFSKEDTRDTESLASKKKGKKGNKGKVAGIMVTAAWLLTFIGVGMILNGTGSLAAILVLSLLSNILAITGFIMGCKAIKKAKKGKGKTGALIAIVLGGIYCLLLLISILTFIAA
jgi:hypothetical protein